MSTRLPLAWFLGLALLSGCTSTSQMPTTTALLAGAHDSLARNDTDNARVWLGSAASRLETDEDRTAYDLLQAELDLRTGGAELAAAQMGSLIARAPDDPRVHELAGKAALLTADFAEAGRHFGMAQEHYAAEADAARAADLLALAQGLGAYAAGNVAAAHEHWQTIQDHELLASVLAASGTVAPARNEELAARPAEPTP